MTLAKVNEEYVFQVIDPATVPEVRAWPRRSLIVVVGVVGGFLLAMFVVIILTVVSQVRVAQKV
jgi:uncharacterized protein involved in exopolysaccharide biosynthesis